MTVGELLEVLEELPEAAEVRLAMQPSWPMQHAVREALLVGECGEDGIAEETEEDVVYLVDGGQLYGEPYLPGAARAEIGW